MHFPEVSKKKNPVQTLKFKSYILLFFVTCVLFACTSRPSIVLSEKKMENVLYDLYLADTEIIKNNYLLNSDQLAKQKLFQSVFDKHKITQAEFDTSLVWYNQNLDLYMKINERIIQRYDVAIENMELEKNRAEADATVRDTTFLTNPVSFTLQTNLRNNIHPFFVDYSDQLDKLKRYHVDFLIMGLSDSITPVLTFSIQCGDTTYVSTDYIKANGLFSGTYYAPLGSKVKRIYGNIYLPSEESNPVNIYNFVVTQRESRNKFLPEITD